MVGREAQGLTEAVGGGVGISLLRVELRNLHVGGGGALARPVVRLTGSSAAAGLLFETQEQATVNRPIGHHPQDVGIVERRQVCGRRHLCHFGRLGDVVAALDALDQAAGNADAAQLDLVVHLAVALFHVDGLDAPAALEHHHIRRHRQLPSGGKQQK